MNTPFIELGILLSIWDRVLAPVPMLFIGLAIGALITGLLVYHFVRKSFQRKQRELKYINAQNGVSNSVLNIVEMGVVAFTEKGTLLFSNKTCLKKLRVEELPQSFIEFVSTFIPDKSVAVQLQLYETDLAEQAALETEEEATESEKIESVTTRVERNNRIIQFHFSKPYFPQSTRRGWVVVLEDVTKIARQEQQRRLFVSTVSHELKTPLSSITGYSEKLLDWGLREQSAEEIRNDVAKISEEGARINAIISNLTYLSQIENNKEKITMNVYKIDKAVETTCLKYQEVARKKGIELSYQSLTANMPTVFGSRSMTEQMVGNLITNAVKYSEPNTNIWVFIQGHENDVTIKVQDQGKGIPRSHVDKVFNAFFRVDETGSRQAGGSGLGLAIVKMMAEVQEARIALVTRCAEDEETEGQRDEVGTDFYITIPTAESVFKEALAGIRDNAERDEVLYKKATKYMRKVNDDVFDLGLDLENLHDPEQEQLLLSQLVFIDEIDAECDKIDAAPSAQPVPTPAMPVQEVPAEPIEMGTEAEEQVLLPDQEEPVLTVQMVPEEEPAYVPTEEPVVVEESQTAPVQENAEMAEAESVPQPEVNEAIEWVSLQQRGATKLNPDPPHLAKPFLSKETIGSQNAEKRRQSRSKHMAEKKKKEEAARVEAAAPQVTSRSLLRQVTEPTSDRNSDGK